MAGAVEEADHLVFHKVWFHLVSKTTPEKVQKYLTTCRPIKLTGMKINFMLKMRLNYEYGLGESSALVPVLEAHFNHVYLGQETKLNEFVNVLKTLFSKAKNDFDKALACGVFAYAIRDQSEGNVQGYFSALAREQQNPGQVLLWLETLQDCDPHEVTITE